MKIFRSVVDFIARQLQNHERSTITILAIVIGVLSGYGAVIFRMLIDLVASAHLGTRDNILEVLSSIEWWRRFLPPFIGISLVVPLIHKYARETVGSGIPQVMESLTIRGGYIRPRVILFKLFATALTLGSGGSAGREGPIVQVGSATGSLIGQMTKASHRRMRILVACGAASAVAATFNAPIAGVLFSLEILVGEYSTMTLSPIIISSVMGTVVSRAHLGDFPAFVIPQGLMTFEFASGWEVGTFLVLGLVCGALGVLFSVTLFRTDDFFTAIKLPVWLKGMIGAAAVALLVTLVPNVAGVGYDTIDGILEGDISSVNAADSLTRFLDNPWLIVLVFFVIKIVATALTIGAGASGGIFAPSLFLGACSGYVFGYALNALIPGLVSSPEMYALVGMGALVSGATHTPMASIIIIFEMTGDYVIILPLMLACMMSVLLATRLDPESIFTRRLTRRGINVRAGREEQVLTSIKVSEVMHKDFTVIPQRTTYAQIVRIITSKPELYFPVMDDDDNMLGILRYYDLREHLFEEGLANVIIARDLVVSDVAVLTSQDSLMKAFDLFNVKDIEQIPVVAEENSRKVVGMISRRDLLYAYNKAVLRKGLDVKALK